MNKHLLIVGTMFLLLSISLSGCDERGITLKGDEGKLVGTWVTDSPYDTLTLLKNGKCKKFTYDGTWSIQDGKLTLIYAIRSKPYEYNYYYSFSDNNSTLTITNIDTGYVTVYTKK